MNLAVIIITLLVLICVCISTMFFIFYRDMNIIKIDLRQIGKTLCSIIKEDSDLRDRVSFLEKGEKLLNHASPLSLTKSGEKLIYESGFRGIFEKLKESLAKELLEKYSPETKYSVQENAKLLMTLIGNEERKEFLPVQAYGL